MLSKVARSALVGWESRGSRIIKASFKTKKEGITMNIIQCYAPTNDSNDDIKDQFYERLLSIIEKCPRKELTILMGDLNAKVGIDNTGYEDIMGRHGLTGTEKQKWGKICKFVCIQQIGHRGHNISTQTFNTAFLRDTDKLNEFKIALNNRFQDLQDLLKEEETTMEDNWRNIDFNVSRALQDLLKEEETSMEDNWKGIKEVCEEVLGLKKHHHKEWISIETLDKIKERRNKKAAINNSRTRAEKVQAQAEYIEANSN
ncbi:unnamed protein product [Schistosoma mattheei]|uniref:Uncharacterized protein n=1 Tax=Schistosoma mattheei TaxID=31246 RepID=A0A183P8E4_9TREM|nr:unnamed protein product [Schistosoma mattheei]